MDTMSLSELTPTLDVLDDAGQALLFTDAHTANTFADLPVADEDLIKIWNLAKWAPTSANFQPMRVLYVKTPEARARLVEFMSDGNKEKTLAAPAVAVLAYDTQFHTHQPTVMPFMPQMQEMFEANEAARIAQAKFNSALQAGYYILAVRARGLAAGPMGGFDTAAADAEFFADGRFRSFLVVNIGHPADDSFRDRLPRLEPEHVLNWV
jgi:3-hydroxypropanoate dehydrogenase